MLAFKVDNSFLISFKAPATSRMVSVRTRVLPAGFGLDARAPEAVDVLGISTAVADTLLAPLANPATVREMLIKYFLDEDSFLLRVRVTCNVTPFPPTRCQC